MHARTHTHTFLFTFFSRYCYLFFNFFPLFRMKFITLVCRCRCRYRRCHRSCYRFFSLFFFRLHRMHFFLCTKSDFLFSSTDSRFLLLKFLTPILISLAINLWSVNNYEQKIWYVTIRSELNIINKHRIHWKAIQSKMKKKCE